MTRFLTFFFTFFIAALGSQCLLRLLPGDPVDTLMAETGTSIPREVLLKELGLDQPWFIAAPVSLGRALQGDFGNSLFSKKPILPILKARLLGTFQLALLSLAITMLLALPLGLIAAQPLAPSLAARASLLCDGWATLSAAIPTPWLGPILLLLFTVLLNVFPIERHLALPAITLAFASGGHWARLIRERVAEQTQKTWFQAALARGTQTPRLLLIHGLAPSASLLVGQLGSQWGGLMAGAYVTEVLFNWPGLGSWIIEGVLRRDYPVVQAGVMLTAFFSLLGNLLGDLAAKAIDPRSKSENAR